MKPTHLTALAAVTAVFAAAAVYLTVEQEARVATSVVPRQTIFPGLIDRINDIQEIEVRDQQATVRIVRQGESWVIPDKNDYPAAFEKTKKFLLDMATAKALEPRTSDPKLYDRLRVGDVDAKESKSILLTLKDAAGKPLAQLIQGKALIGTLEDKTQIYVRKPGEAQSWLALGLDFRHADVELWLDKDVINLPRHRVRRVTNTHPEGEILVATRATPHDDDLVVQDLPKGAKPDTAKINELGSALEWLTFNDVLSQAKAGELKPAGFARYETFEGLTVDVALFTRETGKEKETWVTFDADYAPAGAPLPPLPAAAAGDKEKDGKKPATPDEAKAQAERLAAKAHGWVYKLPDWKVDVFRRKPADVVAKEEKKTSEKSP